MDRVAWLKDHFAGQIPPETIDHYATRADPSREKKYLQWVLRQHLKEDVKPEEHEAIRTALFNFDETKSHMPVEDRDINRHKTLDDLIAKVAPHAHKVSGRKEDQAKKDAGSTLIYENPSLSVRELHTHAAACLYGANTKWCTAAKDYPRTFQEYHKKGPMYVVINKKTGAKFQWHPYSRQFADAKDRNLGPPEIIQKFPSLANVPQFQNEPMFASKEKIEKLVGELRQGDYDTYPWSHQAPPEVTEAHQTAARERAGRREPLNNIIAAHNPNITAAHLNRVAELGGLIHAIEHPNAPPALIDKALDMKADREHGIMYRDEPTRAARVAKTRGNFEKAFAHEDPYVRLAALQNKNAPPELVARGIFNMLRYERKDRDAYTGDQGQYYPYRRLAISNKAATPAHIEMALHDEDQGVRSEAAKHKNATSGQILRAISDPHYLVRYNTLKNPNLSTEHMLELGKNEKTDRVKGKLLESMNSIVSAKEHNQYSSRMAKRLRSFDSENPEFQALHERLKGWGKERDDERRAKWDQHIAESHRRDREEFQERYPEGRPGWLG